MTEKELRQNLVDTAKSYLGTVEGGEKHLEIVSVYNAIRPLPRGYRLKTNDSWCAAFVSVMAAKCGLLGIIPAECSCQHQIAAWQRDGRWKEEDDYVPSVGDCIYYDWQDNTKGDNKGVPDHVGIIAGVSGKHISVIEGNASNSVKNRYISADAKYIRGYGLPDFASVVKEESMRYKRLEDLPEGNYRDTVKEFIELGIIKGKADGEIDLSEDVVRGIIISRRYADKKIGEITSLAADKFIERLAEAIQ